MGLTNIAEVIEFLDKRIDNKGDFNLIGHWDQLYIFYYRVRIKEIVIPKEDDHLLIDFLVGYFIKYPIGDQFHKYLGIVDIVNFFLSLNRLYNDKKTVIGLLSKYLWEEKQNLVKKIISKDKNAYDVVINHLNTLSVKNFKDLFSDLVFYKRKPQIRYQELYHHNCEVLKPFDHYLRPLWPADNRDSGDIHLENGFNLTVSICDTINDLLISVLGDSFRWEFIGQSKKNNSDFRIIYLPLIRNFEKDGCFEREISVYKYKILKLNENKYAYYVENKCSSSIGGYEEPTDLEYQKVFSEMCADWKPLKKVH